MMRFCVSLLLTLVCLSHAHAGKVAFFDFDPDSPDGFSRLGGTVFNTAPPMYNPQAEGASGYGGAWTLAETVTADPGDVIAAGFKSSEFDLAKIPGVTLGDFSVSHFDMLRLSFDARIMGDTQLNALRFISGELGLPRGTISLGLTVALNQNAGGGFQRYHVNFAEFDEASKADFVYLTNGGDPRGAGPTTLFYLDFEFAQRNGQYYAGDSIVFDNIDVSAIPEPSTLTVSLTLAALGLTFSICRLRKSKRTGPPSVG